MLTRYRFELILAVALFAICAIVAQWQSPGTKLTAAEVDAYVARADANLGLPADYKASMLASLRQWGMEDDGREVYMLNLMKMNGALRHDRGLPASVNMSPVQSNLYYEQNVMPIALRGGAFPIYSGTIRELGLITRGAGYDLDRVIVMHYPNRRAFMELISDPVYGKFVAYKLSALEIDLIPSNKEMVIPDFRQAAVAVSLIIFLAAGWFRASRRVKEN